MSTIFNISNKLKLTNVKPLLLDLYTGSAVAYSLRSLSSITNNVVRVREDAGNTEQDFTAEEITDGTLETFVGAGNNGYVVTWYDQSGNGNDATQGAAASQPKIVDAGVLVEENGKPAVNFDGTDDFLSNTFPSTISQPTYWFVTHNFHATPSGFDGVIAGFSTDTEHRLILDASLTYTLQAGGVIKYNSYQTSQSLVSYKIDASDERFYFNGSEQTASSGSGIGSDGLQSIILGALNQTSGNTPVQFQEIIIYDSDQSTNRTGIENNIGRYYNIDGFTDGRVAKWYDQANANHATQSTPDKQPLIVSDGALVLENSKPAIKFDGVDDVLRISPFNGNAIVAGSSFITSVSSYRGDSIDGFNTICHVGGIEDSQISLITIGYNQTGNALVSGKYLGGYVHRLGDSSQINTQHLNTLDFSSSFDLYQDGVLATYNMSPSADVSSNVLSIGGGGSGNNHFLAGNTQELIIYDSDQSTNRQDIEKNIADYYEITLSGNSGVESWVKNVSFADMYQIWFDYEYLHRLFANFEIPNQVHKILAYSDELTADQKQQVYDYLQKNYHPIYTPYSTRVLADGGTLAAGQTNTLTIIDSI